MQKNPIEPSQPSTTDTSLNPTSSLPARPNALPTARSPGDPALFPSHAVLPFDGPHHRRARSELSLRISEDVSPGDPMSTGSFEEMGSEDDPFFTFMDMEKIGCKMEGSLSGPEDGDPAAGSSARGKEGRPGNAGESKAGETSRPKHLHINSADGSGEMMEVKKAMTEDQLEKLAAIDPKRAKRILANRQSAARSKERKAHYISELERRVQILQSEATTLSTQLTLYQRDIICMTAENAELKLRLQDTEQQAQLGDALNEALKQEVDRLKLATGEPSRSAESNNALQHHFPFNPSFVPIPQQQVSFCDSHPISDSTSLQRLNIGNGSAKVKSESSSL
ncbi:Transcription factor RF2b [Platanthera guangdongensis]|uniref:Transcription factor RF2b n=1 Tax=Platanthera guangdongensis TaxID=2320717 RepID=A0ABR2LF74_9ASPA